MHFKEVAKIIKKSLLLNQWGNGQNQISDISLDVLFYFFWT